MQLKFLHGLVYVETVLLRWVRQTFVSFGTLIAPRMTLMRTESTSGVYISTRTSQFHDFTYILSVVLFSHVVFILYSFCLLYSIMLPRCVTDW